MTNDSITVAMTGASGADYGVRLVECLLEAGVPVNLLLSQAAQVVLAMETDLKVPNQPKQIREFFCEHFGCDPKQLQVYGKDQWSAPIASGSNISRAMVICPCSSGTLSSIASGSSDSLLERAADVTIKEQRKLVLVPREMPMSPIHLEHMLKLARIGVVIMPASPGFYHRPETIRDLVDFVVARILDHLSVANKLVKPWG